MYNLLKCSNNSQIVIWSLYEYANGKPSDYLTDSEL